jgi:hypothetical protein
MKTKEIIDSFRTLVLYHEDIIQFQNTFTGLIKGVSINKTEEMFNRFQAYILTDLDQHFKFEELVVFPAVIQKELHSSPRRKLVKQLTLEHGAFMEQATQIIKDSADFSNNKNFEYLKQITENMGDLLGKIMQHATIENQNVVPLVKYDNNMRFVINRGYFKHKLIFTSLKPK